MHRPRLQRVRGGFVPHTVLIADDNRAIRQGLRDLFQGEGDFDVCGEAENGREAVEKAQQLHPDLILLDLSMPVMNGLEAAGILKKLMSEVPVIIYSAHKDPMSKKEADSAGIWAWISKSEKVSV
jgi:two-component system nitrate/nitrite response regulator NarL